MAPSPMINNVPVAAPLNSNGNGFSPWWIIGPLLAILAVMAVGALAYLKKKQNNPENKDKNNEENRDGNIPLKDIKSNGFPNPQKKTISALSAKKGMISKFMPKRDTANIPIGNLSIVFSMK